jgi:hypothetical protein
LRNWKRLCVLFQVPQDKVLSCEYGEEISNSVKHGEYIDQMSEYQLIKRNYAART